MSSKCILIIDDDQQRSKSFARVLNEEGYEVLMAASGEKGLESLHEHAPDQAVLDIRLPGMDGLKVLQAIQEQSPKLPVVMTAYDSTETAIEAMKYGAFDYVYKPFEPREMLTTISGNSFGE